MNPNKQILVLGAGGHGTISLTELFQSKVFSFDVVFHTADWGGSQGLWGRLLKLGDYFLDRTLNEKSNTFLPFGDPNKLINYYAQQKFADLDFFDLRSSDFKIVEEKSKVFLDLIRSTDGFKKEFLNYLKIAFDYYIINRKKLGFKKELCVGYLFHAFLLKKTASVLGWNKALQELEIIPKNLTLGFCSDSRTIMVAKDISLVKLIGEDKVDHHDNPILPDSVHLSDPLTKKSISEPAELFAKIQSADLIILPTGSITNWVCVLNIPGVVELLKTKKVIWITNPYKSRNELDNLDYFNYFQTLGITPIILKSRKDSKLVSKFVLTLNKKGRYEPGDIKKEVEKILDVVE
jgi:hypothetical protein